MVSEIQLIVIKWMIYVAFVIIVVALMFTYIPTFVDHLVSGYYPEVYIREGDYSKLIDLVRDYLLHDAYGQTPPTPVVTVQQPQFLPPQVQYAPIEVKPSGQNDYLAMIMPLILGAGGVILAKFTKDTNDKVKKVENTSKENANAIVDSKVVAQELARLLFEWNEQKANALNGTAPAVKLETLKDDTKKAVDTATNA